MFKESITDPGKFVLHSQATNMKNLLAFANIPLKEVKFKESLADPGKFEASAQLLALRVLQCTMQPSRGSKEAEMFKESPVTPASSSPLP